MCLTYNHYDLQVNVYRQKLNDLFSDANSYVLQNQENCFQILDAHKKDG